MEHSSAPRHRARGFTLIELLIVIALVMIVALIGYPALMNTLRRAQVTGAAKEVANAVRVARLEAIKRSRPVGALAQTNAARMIVFEDTDENGALTAGEEINRFPLRPNIQFMAPGESPGGAGAVVGFTEVADDGWVLFASDGSADEVGAFRIGDPNDNYFEVRVEPRASGRVTIRKWDATTSDWKVQGEGGKSWSFN